MEENYLVGIPAENPFAQRSLEEQGPAPRRDNHAKQLNNRTAREMTCKIQVREIRRERDKFRVKFQKLN